ncbi:HAD family phosphatase [Kitasatospora sp. RB6PN24]|uniref:HAD family hydrolase n=1 Tax=Kitasatospora humi TaxID=2893891 RepID=UPI001E543627|nr:HAD family phosphatase [Kitasatospora humi]MCC9307196.1 HAD family phosphatase [Kitasatospora humi]
MTPQTPDRRYRALILDFGGVLTDNARLAIRRWCVSEGLDEEAWRRTRRHPDVRSWYRELERGTMSQAEWNRRTAPVLGVADHENLMGRAWSGVTASADMVALAKAARRAGYRLAMLSNSFGLDPYDPYAACGVWELFDVTVVSELAGMAKPDPEIYRLALERLDLPGEACVFVDDYPGNLPPAQALGITTVLATKPHRGVVEQVGALLGLDGALA